MKLVEVLQLTGFDRQLESLECDLSTHNNQLSLKVSHHVVEEIASHFVELLAINLVLNSITQFVAHTSSQRIHRRDFFDCEVLDLACKNVSRVGQFTCDLAMRHKLDCKTLAYSTCDQIEHGIVIDIFFIIKQFTNECPTTGCSECAAT